MKVISRFDVLSVMKLAGVIYGIVGIVVGVFFAMAVALGLFAAQGRPIIRFLERRECSLESLWR